MTYEPRIYDNDYDSDDEEPPEFVSRYNYDYDSDSEIEDKEPTSANYKNNYDSDYESEDKKIPTLVTYDSSDSEDEEEDDDDTNEDKQHIFSHFNDKYMRHYLLLDNQSTIDLFCNPDLLNNIRKVNRTLSMTTNGGCLTTSRMGTLENYGDVWYHEEALTNILSLQNLHQKGYGIQYDNEDKDVFLVTKPNGK